MTVIVDASGLEAKIREFYGEVADRAVLDMIDEMQATAPRDTGEMASSVYVADRPDSGDQIVRVVRAPAEWSSYQEEGTGIYGPQGTPIVPVNAKVLVFYWKQTGRIEFRKSVLGSPATHWWSNVIEKWADWLQGALR